MKKISAMCVCGLCMALMIGCGNKEADISSADIVETFDTVKLDENSEEAKALSGAENESAVQNDNVKNKNSDNVEDETFVYLANEEVPKTEIDTDKFTDELCGKVISINAAEKFVMVSKIYTEENGNSQIAVAPAEGSSDEELITVYFTGEAKYILETGKADGTNVNRTEAQFSDITEKDTLNLKGMENTIGTEFLATEIEIICVIN